MYDPVTLTVLRFGLGGVFSVIVGEVFLLSSFITEQDMSERMLPV